MHRPRATHRLPPTSGGGTPRPEEEPRPYPRVGQTRGPALLHTRNVPKGREPFSPLVRRSLAEGGSENGSRPPLHEAHRESGLIPLVGAHRWPNPSSVHLRCAEGHRLESLCHQRQPGGFLLCVHLRCGAAGRALSAGASAEAGRPAYKMAMRASHLQMSIISTYSHIVSTWWDHVFD